MQITTARKSEQKRRLPAQVYIVNVPLHFYVIVWRLGEGLLYKCPLYPCDWTCDQDAMKKGPAVIHLLRVHNIQPLEIKERGIKFNIHQT